ncbi:MAG: 50S ribosomal protein L21 [Lachnospiraceae bacterium]|nr:50S ribosomal protein L21 [Lachnospiraceae bacterium]
MYAIIETGGKQYKVSEGDKVRVEKLEGEVGAEVTFDQVLLVSNGDVAVGNPVVEGAKVLGKITAQGKAKKIIVYKYKPKSGYHKKNGHRQLFTEVEITNIAFGSNKEEVKEEVTAEPEEVKVEEVAVEEVKEEAAQVTEE